MPASVCMMTTWQILSQLHSNLVTVDCHHQPHNTAVYGAVSPPTAIWSAVILFEVDHYRSAIHWRFPHRTLQPAAVVVSTANHRWKYGCKLITQTHLRKPSLQRCVRCAVHLPLQSSISIRVQTITVLGYWPILAGIEWYWYRPNTFVNNRAQYWADSSLWCRIATHDDLISRNSLWNRQLLQCEKSCALHDRYIEA